MLYSAQCARAFLLLFLASAQAWKHSLQGDARSLETGRPSFLRARSNDAVHSTLQAERVDAASFRHRVGEVVWTRRKGVYCSDNWDLKNVKKAKTNNVRYNDCKEQCAADKTCMGVSVTNANWGDRKPWCHMCTSRAVKEHSNLDTFFVEELSASEMEEWKTQKRISNIKELEAVLCSDPGKTTQQDLDQIKTKPLLLKKLKEVQAKVISEEQARVIELKTSRGTLEGKYNGLKGKLSEARSEGNDAESKKLKADMEHVQQQLDDTSDEIHKIEKEKPRIRLEDEQARLQKDLAGIRERKQVLSTEERQKEDAIHIIRRDLEKMTEKDDEDFWKDWLKD